MAPMTSLAQRSPTPAIHGGDLRQIAEVYGIAPAQMLDLSVNINPRGLPAGASGGNAVTA